MKVGQLLHGYRVTSPPTNNDAGKCMWATAEKDGHEFFVKEFLDPKRPRPGSMGTAESKRLLLAECEEFEQRHRMVMNRIDPDDLDAGNLVMALDFFAEGSRYYKITRLLRPAKLPGVHRLSPRQRGILFGTLCDSLLLLHRLDIVHGDLKPQNVLLHRPSGSDLYTAKLIDFDDSYMSGDPPARHLIGGDIRYAPPEWVRYVHRDAATGPQELTTAVDTFALGLLAHVYLTGRFPEVAAPHVTPGEAVNAGEPPELDQRLHPALAEVLRSLTTLDPAERPSIADVAPALTEPELLGLRSAPPAPAARQPSRLRINLGHRGEDAMT